MARTYKRDSNGRFAGGGGGGGGGRSRPAAKPAPRGTNRLTRDNAGKITSVGGNGATARGGRLRTAAGNQRATQTARAKGGARAGVIKGRVTRNPGAMGKAGAKVSAEQRAIATAYKKRVNSRNILATRTLQRSVAAKHGLHGKYAIRDLTRTMDAPYSTASFMGTGRMAQPLPLRQQRGNPYSASRSKELGLNRGPTNTLWQSAPINKQNDNAYSLHMETLSGRHSSAALRAGAAQQRRRRASSTPAKPTPKPATRTRKLTRQTPGTIANKTGQSKTLNKFNSRPVGTKILVGNKMVPSKTRVPLNVLRSSSDAAFARVATKTARAKAGAVVKTQQKQTTAQRATRAAANQKRVIQEVMAKGGKRPTPTKKQRRSIFTAEAAKNVYATNSIDTLRVNTKKPGYRILGR